MNRPVHPFYNSEEYKRSEDLLAEIGHRTDLDSVKITLDSYSIRLADQSDVVDRFENDELIEVTGIYGIKVATVLQSYASIAHLIPDCDASIPWKTIADKDSKADWSAVGNDP